MVFWNLLCCLIRVSHNGLVSSEDHLFLVKGEVDGGVATEKGKGEGGAGDVEGEVKDV